MAFCDFRTGEDKGWPRLAIQHKVSQERATHLGSSSLMGALASSYLDTDGSQLGCTSELPRRLLKITPHPDQLQLEGKAQKSMFALLPHQAIHMCRQGELLHESHSTTRWFCFFSQVHQEEEF